MKTSEMWSPSSRVLFTVSSSWDLHKTTERKSKMNPLGFSSSKKDRDSVNLSGRQLANRKPERTRELATWKLIRSSAVLLISMWFNAKVECIIISPNLPHSHRLSDTNHASTLQPSTLYPSLWLKKTQFPLSHVSRPCTQTRHCLLSYIGRMDGNFAYH